MLHTCFNFTKMHVSFIIACLSIRYINYTKSSFHNYSQSPLEFRDSWLRDFSWHSTYKFPFDHSSVERLFFASSISLCINFLINSRESLYIIIYVANSSWKVQTTVRITWHAKWLTICYDRYAVNAEPTMRSLRIRPASRITFNARLMSTRP